MSIKQRGERHVERMAGISERGIDHIETMSGPEILASIDQIEKADKVARRSGFNFRPQNLRAIGRKNHIELCTDTGLNEQMALLGGVLHQ